MLRLLAGLVSCLFVVPSLVHAQVTLRYIVAAPVNVLTTELNSLPNNAYSAASAAQNNLFGGGGGNGALLCEFELFATFAAPPTAGTAVQVWLLTSVTDFETAWNVGGTIGPGRGPDLTFPVVKGQTESRVTQEITCPPGLWKAQALSDNTGQAMAASGNTLKVRYVTILGN